MNSNAANPIRLQSNRRVHKKNQNHLRQQLRKWLKALLLVPAASTMLPAVALAQVPTGGNVVAGAATIANAAGNMDVNATTARAIVNWDSFSIGAGNTANFNLPDANSAILNRVTGTDLSTIAGTLNSNGNVFLVNPNGIMVGNTGVINTNGFTASVFDVGNDAFMAGGPLSFSGDSTASIVNNGSINTGAGGAHLIANQITNNGTIESTGGNITLSGGGEVTLDGGVSYVQPSLDTLASGISPTAGLIQNDGVIRATGAATAGGEVYLVNPNGRILHDGTIAATRAVEQAPGLVTSSTTGEATVGGSIMLEADDITLTANSTIEATGTHGGGEVLVGGDWEGGKEEPEFAQNLADPSSDAFHARRDVMTQASKVLMESGAVIDASATEQGDGGKIVLWSDITNADSLTEVFGTLLAKAGTLFGDGGYIETSGASIDTSGITAIASAPAGIGGLWLIDPYDYNIDATAAANIVGSLQSGTSVTVTTNTANSSHGSQPAAATPKITVASDIVTGNMSGEATLTFIGGQIDTTAGSIDATTNGNDEKLNVVIRLLDGSFGDAVLGSIKTNGGHLWVGGSETNDDTTTWNGLTVGDGHGLAKRAVRIQGTLDTRGSGSGGEIRIGAGRDGSDLEIGAFQGNSAVDIFSGDADATFLSGRHIEIYQEVGITTDGGDVLLASDVLGQNEGAIGAGTQSSGRDLTISTSGGNITLGGGALDGSGFAAGNDGNGQFSPEHGIGIRGELTLNSSGGDITLRGRGKAGAAGTSGVFFNEDSYIDSGDGELLIHGFASGGSGAYYGISAADNTTLTLSSSNDSSDAISLIGNASFFGGTSRAGVFFENSTVNIWATGDAGISITGRISNTGTRGVYFGDGQFLAENGPLSITADHTGNGNAKVDLSNMILGIVANSSDETYADSSISIVSDYLDIGDPTINLAGSFSLLSSGGSFSGNDHNFDAVIENASNVTIGRSTNASAVSLNESLDFTGDLNIYGSEISLGFGKQITGTSSSTATFHGTTANDESNFAGSIQVGNLAFAGVGDFVADSIGNDVTTFASSTSGDVELNNSGSLIIGEVGSMSGIQSQGTISVSTLSNDLTVSRNVSTTDTSNDAVRLIASIGSSPGAASGGNILITNDATVTVGTDGRAILYSGSVSGSTGLTDLVGSGSGRFRYNSDEQVSNFTKALESGVYAIYRERPDYDGTNFNDSSVYSDNPTVAALNGDRLSVDVDTILSTTSGNVPIGTYSAEFANNAGADLGYGTVTGSGTIEITKRDVTVQNLNVADRVYDGTRVASVDHANVSFDNIITGDILTASNTLGQFDGKDSGDDRVVTLSGTTYGGADLGNYNITDQTQTTATINKRPITVSGITASDKVYDGQTTSTVKLDDVVFGNIIAGEQLTISDTIGTFADKNVGVDKVVTLSGNNYGGADVGNYSFNDQPSAVATITRLDGVNWIGAASGQWSDASNWAGGAIPDLANVANVIIPGGIWVILNDLGSPVEIDSLTGGRLQLIGGTLNVARDVSLSRFSQNNGAVNIGGNFAVDGSFDQAGPRDLKIAGDATIRQTDESLVVRSLQARNVDLTSTNSNVLVGQITATGGLNVDANGGQIAQLTGGNVIVGGATVLKASENVKIDGHADFAGPVSASGVNVVLTDTGGGLVLDVIDATTFDTKVSHGDLTQTGASNIDVSGTSTFDVDGNVVLDGQNNRLLGAVSAKAKNFDLGQAASELLLGDIDISEALAAWTSGTITQTKKGSVKVNGTARLLSTNLLLSNFTNEFSKVIYTASAPVINAAKEFERCLLGGTGESILDTFGRVDLPGPQQVVGLTPVGGTFGPIGSDVSGSVGQTAQLVSPVPQVTNFFAKSSGGEVFVGTKANTDRDID
ncbi:MAG: hypothetical protein Aurels2KO_52730 [Aureliella sp.]